MFPRRRRSSLIVNEVTFDPSVTFLTATTPRAVFDPEFGKKQRPPVTQDVSKTISIINFLVAHWDVEACPEITLILIECNLTICRIILNIFPRIARLDVWNAGTQEASQIDEHLFVFPAPSLEGFSLRYLGTPEHLFFMNPIKDYKLTLPLQTSEELLLSELKFQSDIFFMIKPVKAMLSFRTPYSLPSKSFEHIEYFSGVIQVPPFSDPKTNYTYLVPIPDPDGLYKMVSYDTSTYEEQIFYLNSKLRSNWKLKNSLGLRMTYKWLNNVNSDLELDDGIVFPKHFDTAFLIHIIHELLIFTNVRQFKDPLTKISSIWNWIKSVVYSNELKLSFNQILLNDEEPEPTPEKVFFMSGRTSPPKTPERNFRGWAEPTNYVPDLPGRGLIYIGPN